MSPASTQHLQHACTSSGSSSPCGQAHASSSIRSRHHSPVSPTAPASHDYHMAAPRQSSQRSETTMPHSSAELERTQVSQYTDMPSSQPNTTESATRQLQPQQQAQQQHKSIASRSPSAQQQRQPQQMRLPTAPQRRRAPELATVLLTLATCHVCQRPLHDPVTLPCGHSSCLQCIKDRLLPKSIPPEEQVKPLPCLSHLPPRLPLSPMTVACPAHGCPRSAIGRGIGAWAGHQPRYGLIPTYTERLPVGSEDVGPGAPPADGFVMGVADHPLRLTVIGPQTRSKAHLFALPPHGVDSNSATAAGQQQMAATRLPSLATCNLLRPDVTLSKAVAILMHYASSPLPRPPRQRRGAAGSSRPSSSSSSSSQYSRPGAARDTNDQSAYSARARGAVPSRRSLQSRPTSRRLAATAPSSAAASSRRYHPSGMSQAGMGIFGRNESDLESGTVGGVRAAYESDDQHIPADGTFFDDSDDDPSTDTAHQRSTPHGRTHSMHIQVDRDQDKECWTLHAGTDEEHTEEEDDRLWPDHVGGAFSRPPLSAAAIRRRDKARLKRRRGRGSDDSTLSAAASFRKGNAAHTKGKVAKRDPSHSVEEAVGCHVDSAVSHGLHGEHASEALVDAVRRRRAQQALASNSNASKVESDADADDAIARNRNIEAKHSLALSSRVGVNGEPLIQTVATLHSELAEVLECQLCYLLLYDPLTTPCGHTFCKSCFARSLDHADRCPLCRADVPNFSFFQDHRPNTALLKILTSDTATFSDEDGMHSDSTQEAKHVAPNTYAGISIAMGSGGDAAKHVDNASRRAGYMIDDDPETAPHHYGFKRLYEQRKAAIQQEEREARLSTPIFVCTLAFPGMPTILHIFEPRYRLMVRRCLESGNPRFGMVLPWRNNGGTEEYGTMLEIKSVQMLADGRSMLETVGSYRFRLLEKGSLDGYTVGRVERVDDISLEEEAELERSVLMRRAELDKKKAAKAVEPPPSQPMSCSSSAPVRTVPSGSNEAEEQQASLTRPEMLRAERDVLSIYQSDPSAPQHQDDWHPEDPDANTPAADTATNNSNTAPEEQEQEQEEEGMLPFKPVPAEPSIEELTAICTSFIETLRSGSAPWLLSRLNHTYGPMPSADQVERLGYWMALVMPIDEHEKAKLLPIRSRRLRLCLVVHWIEQLRQSWWFNSGCTVS
ncbi:hypothetical protein NDA14_002949 [Ustilago hordei]|nr:hypothetical protein NDA14_002949 [Ustilago hordei]